MLWLGLFLVFMPAFSVLIPTYNRREKLKVVLEALSKQPGLAEGEVIVGIDGSTDGTEDFLRSIADEYPAALNWFSISNSGRAVIRNRLLDRAKGDILLFIQDDIVVSEGWLQGHLDFHGSHPGVAVVGYITWYPQAKITPYMKWLENGGHLLSFSGLRSGQPTDFWHFYMGNISFPRSLVQGLRFDEGFKGYGWEDILFGYRFVLAGNSVYYSSLAKAFHWDEYREGDLESYMKQVAHSAVLAEKKYPGLGFVPPLWKRCLFSLLIALGAVLRFCLPGRWKWYLDMKKWFLQGVREARS